MTITTNMICKECKQKQWSPLDRAYYKLFKRCWSCEKKDWEEGKLSTEKFEMREKQALVSMNR